MAWSAVGRRRAWLTIGALSLLAAGSLLAGGGDPAAPVEPAVTTTPDPAGTEPLASPSTMIDQRGRAAVVSSITDGDTFRTTSDERVRLIGVDTPEVDQESCFAAEATAALTALIGPGTEVRLVPDVETTDRYGRTLAYVHRAADDLFVNRELALQGYAVQLTVPPNVARADELGAAVAEAQLAGRGLWATCSTTATTSLTPAVPPAAEASDPSPTSQPALSTGCDPAYPSVCLPPAPPDVDCRDIPHQHFSVVGADPHGFDGDHDGVGCES